MGQVKFIQLGTNVEPKKDYEVSSVNEYRTELASAIANYPGAVIFTTFKKSENGKPKNEIYANGQLYSAGGGSGAVYYGTVAVGADGQIEDFSLNHEGAEPEKGNVYIYDPEDNSSKTLGGNIADCTAYYYNGEEWVAFTGNVNAENVWFPNGVDRTEVWGAATTANATPKSECIGSNLKELLENYLVKESFAQSTISRANTSIAGLTGQLVTQPSISVSQNIILNSTESGTYYYYPAVRKTSNCISTGTITFGPQTIVNKIGYKTSKDQVGYTSGNKVGDTISIAVNVSDITPGSGEVIVKVGGTQVATSNYENGENVTGTWNIDTTSLGTKTVTLTATNSATCSATYTKGSESVTYINIPGISTIYPVTNKGNIPTTEKFGSTAQPNGISASEYRIPTTGSFAASLSYNASPTTSVNYTIYLPIKSNMTKGGNITNSITELKKFTGTEFSIVGYLNGTNPTTGSERYILLYPSSYMELRSITPAGQDPLTQGTHYKIEEFGSEYGVNYKKITIDPQYKYSNKTNLELTFQFSKVSN